MTKTAQMLIDSPVQNKVEIEALVGKILYLTSHNVNGDLFDKLELFAEKEINMIRTNFRGILEKVH